MNSHQALAAARKRWGKEAAVEDTKRESSPALREAAKLEAARLVELATAARAAHAEVAKEFGTARPEYKTSLAARIAADKAHLNARSATHHHRYKVGTVMNMGGFGCFSIDGEGDTWEEAFAKADERKVKLRA